MIDVSKIESKLNGLVEEDKIPKGIRQDILDSWIRCKKYKLDVNIKGKEIDKVQFDKILVEHKELIEIAIPVMLDIFKLLNETNYSIVLTDENAVILKVMGNKEIIEKNRELNFLKGCNWKEENVGTNAIGTCLYLNKPFHTLSAEHYCKAQHGWTCSAAPIHDEKGKIIGIIDLSGHFYDFHSHTLGIVVEAANAIQKQFSINEHRKWAGAAFNSIEDGILVIDNDFMIKDFNLKLCEIFKISGQEIYKIDIRVLLKDIIKDMHNFSNNDKINYREISFYLNNSRVECNVSVTPVKNEKEYIGFVILVKKADSLRHVVNKIAGFYSKWSFDNIITKNPKMISLIEEAKRIAANDCTVLITGESGTGKELFAHSIHNASTRCNGPFVAINCAALPKNLVESELFGYDKGTFTGASKEGCPGKFELANKGTIFLDEIGELPLEIQSKLLRVLDSHTITRIGGKYEKKLNVRVITATNRNLYNQIKTKNFRDDLYYRINVFNIKLIPLRERLEDVEVYAELFLQQLNDKNPESKKFFDKEFINSIKKYNWPGNVREVENIIQRAYYLSKNNIISCLFIPEYINEDIEDIKDIKDIKDTIGIPDDNVFKTYKLEEIEKNLIVKALEYCDGNVVKASKLIGIGKTTFYRKVKKYIK
ncbi:sigma 54-interacting transcriptional regulator [Clostridium algoriphilum]|uniref:sigma-54-dependent Fis family transcriptional regulator n=1 Tax=Clostridium algoriphilum TaxID=198347 RepID=UPI001CF3D23A|nr:sigma 54-interacting transcriptional regulator [Clostridium algoriphilum]MCB2292598.1 sigma 54-interacting transcriptional regulator [Clostridium algoriphilum]